MNVRLLLLLFGAAAVQRSASFQPELHRRLVRTLFPNNGTSNERCYGVYGCFSIGRPWTSNVRPINSYPEAPDVIDPQFCVYTRATGVNGRCQNVILGDLDSLKRSGIQPNRRVLFITHGYLESGHKNWIKKMVDEALVHDDLNAVVVDWVGGSGPPYSQAANNIRLAGVILAHLILFLHAHAQIRPEQCHIVGHSLGAHLAGYAGAHLNQRGYRLGRITGLDPADPYFENTERQIRLDSTDALFVDIIHTDAAPFLTGGLGLMQLSGHVDFYPNGGVQQPGCGENLADSIEKERGSVLFGLRRFIGCNHIRSYEFFTESFNSPCPFLAVQCPSYEDFRAGLCQCGGTGPGPRTNCFRMGYQADRILDGSDPVLRPEQTQAYLLTGSFKPYCQYHYRVTAVISDTDESLRRGSDRGYLTVQLIGDQATSAVTRLTSEPVRFEPGQVYSFVMGTPWLGHVHTAKVKWHYASNVFNPFTWRMRSVPAIYLNRIVVHNYETNNSTEICGEDAMLTSEEPRALQSRTWCRPQPWDQAGAGVGTGVGDVNGAPPLTPPPANRLRRKGRRSRARKILNIFKHN